MTYWLIKFRRSGLYYDVTVTRKCRSEVNVSYDSLEEARDEIRSILDLDNETDIKLVSENGKPYIVKVNECDKSKDDDFEPDKLEFLILWRDLSGHLRTSRQFSDDIVEAGVDWHDQNQYVPYTNIASITQID